MKLVWRLHNKLYIDWYRLSCMYIHPGTCTDNRNSTQYVHSLGCSNTWWSDRIRDFRHHRGGTLGMCWDIALGRDVMSILFGSNKPVRMITYERCTDGIVDS
jgi:hypothetical protein